MKRLESNLSSDGATRVPKELRDALDAANGGRLAWQLLPDGTLRATLKHRYVARRAAHQRLPIADAHPTDGAQPLACLTNEQVS